MLFGRVELVPFSDEERQLIKKIQSDDFISQCTQFFIDKGMSIEHIGKSDTSEGKNIFCTTVLWISTSRGTFDISCNLKVYGGRGILDSKLSGEFWRFYKKILK